ncbi:hypothetical protein niasHT_037574 [Heterodera trifolii]|uniref:Uncharacterized protein n=1 Tax=Heterodera trifolii TaxID=157864 RepID=A0ABD2I3N0_9BILA
MGGQLYYAPKHPEFPIMDRSFPDAPPTRAPRDLRNKSRAPLGRLTSNFTGHYPPPPKLNGERISSLPPFQAVHSRRPAHSRTPRLAQQNSRTPCPIDFKFYRPSFHHPLSCTAKEFRLRHHFERSFPDAPPTRAPRDLRNKSRAPLVRLTSNFTAIHSTIPLAERRKNFASGTILSGVFPTPRPLAHPETCAAKLAHPLPSFHHPLSCTAKEFRLRHHFERSFPNAPPTRAPRDLRNKSRAPLVRLTSNFTVIHSTIPLAERRKNFASGTILSGVFPTPRPLAHPETCAAKLAHPLHHFERSFPDAPPTRAPRDLRNKSRAPLGRLTSNFTGHYPPPPKLNGERISSLPPFQAVHSRRPAHSRTPRLAQQNSRTPCPIDFKFYRHHFERSFPDAPPHRAPPRIAQQNSRTRCPRQYRERGPWKREGVRAARTMVLGSGERGSVEERGSASTDDGMVGRSPRQWKGVRGREGVRRTDDAMVGRGPWKRGGPRRPDGDQRRGGRAF